MISKNEFKTETLNIINEGKVERVDLSYCTYLADLINDDSLLDMFYNDFKQNYEMLYDNDNSNILCKIQDFIFRLNIFGILVAERENPIEQARNLLTNYDFNLYDSVSYDVNETKEIISDFCANLRAGLKIWINL